MTTTTDVVQDSSLWETYRRHGYFFREVAMLTIAIGYFLHLYRVIFGEMPPFSTYSRRRPTSSSPCR
jgi:hypothetical protein